jgi:hypothetical protein
MEKELKGTKTTTAGAAAEKIEKSAEKKPVRITQEEALLRAVKQGKTFNLYRSYYVSERNEKSYYSYPVFIVLPNSMQQYVEVDLKPDNGYISAKDEQKKHKMTSRNSANYALLNMLYDAGNGLTLELRATKKKDSFENGYIDFEYYATCFDMNGVGAEVCMKTDNPGAIGMLNAAFCGFGNSRDAVAEDFKNIPGLQRAFTRLLGPGEVPPDGIEENAE